MGPSHRYIAVLLFSSHPDTPGSRPLHREDVVLVHAPDDDAAVAEAKRHARGSEVVRTTGHGETVTDRFVELVDLAPLLDEDLSTTTDLYSRHFRDLDAYRRFDPLLGGELR